MSGIPSLEEVLDVKPRTERDIPFDAVERFYDEVCAEAEVNMLKTGKLEGSHFAAMQTVLSRWRERRNGKTTK